MILAANEVVASVEALQQLDLAESP